MASLQSLAPDHRAVLSLLLKQGKSYENLSGLLGIDTGAVRDRTHDAVDALGPRETTLTADAREDIADYLLGQQTASERAATRSRLEGSAAARAWARVVSAELRGLAGDSLPEIPAEGAEIDEAFSALDARRAAAEVDRRTSKLGGALLLAGLGLLIAVVLILLLTGGSSKKSTDTNASVDTIAATTATTAAQTGTTPQVVGQVNLVPPHGGRALGIANVLTLQGQLAVAMQAQGLAPTSAHSFYAVWLYNSVADAERLGFAPPVTSNGRLQATATLTRPQSRFHQLVITRESARAPAHPGQIVLAGAIAIPAS